MSKHERMNVVRLAPGSYLVGNRYEVNRTREGAVHTSGVAWYWRDRRSAAKSGLFATKAEAIAHLTTGKPEPDITPRPRRGYSKAFTATGKRAAFYMPDIPAEFWHRVRAKAQREGVSMRGLILQLLSEWEAASEPTPSLPGGVR